MFIPEYDPHEYCRDLPFNDVVRSGVKEHVLKFLHDQTVSPGYVFSSESPVAIAAGRGYLEIMNILIEHGFPAQNYDFVSEEETRQPIHIACCNGHLDIVRSLYEDHHVDLQAFCHGGGTPIGYAIKHNRFEIVKYFVEAGIDVNRTGEDFDTAPPLNLAARSSKGAQICKFLLNSGADVNSKGYGLTPLFDASNEGYTDIVEVLLEAGANTELTTKPGITPLFVAIMAGNLLVAKMLLAGGANPLIVRANGDTLLHVAISHFTGEMEVIRFLVVDAGVPLNMTNNRNETPLSLALSAKHYDIIYLLYKVGLDLSKEDCLRTENRCDDVVLKLKDLASNPRDLADLTCIRIRSLLGKNLSDAVKQFPLPIKLQNLLLLKLYYTND